MSKHRYLGDGVYVTHEPAGHGKGDVILTTGHHEPHMADNVVVLESSLVMPLVEQLVDWDNQSQEEAG